MNDHRTDQSLRTAIIGQEIVRILRTPWSEPVVIVEGLGAAVHCDIVFELSSGLRLSVFYDSVGVSEEPLDRLVELEKDLKPARAFGVILALVVDQWDALHILLQGGRYLQVNPGGASGYACQVDGGEIESLRMVDDIPYAFQDYWSGETVDIHSLKTA